MISTQEETDKINNFNPYQDKLLVLDNLFPDWFVDHVHDTIHNSYGWNWGHTTYFEDNITNETPCLKQQIFPAISHIHTDTCWKMFYKVLINNLKYDVKCHEIMVNGQQYIHDTIPHTDHPTEDSITILYYANREWHDAWGGETILHLKSGIKKILPKPGRVAFFQGSIEHHGLPPNKTFKGLRTTVAFKTKIENIKN